MVYGEKPNKQVDEEKRDIELMKVKAIEGC